MAILIKCPNVQCQKAVSVDESVSGKNVRCRRCGTSFVATPTVEIATSETRQATPDTVPRDTQLLPASFGRYELRQLLGKGGMGAVYLAMDTQLNRRVALKIPFFNASEEPKRAERFMREARSAARLNHPNICTVFDVGEYSGRLFLTMAFIEGSTLEDLLEVRGALSVSESLEIIRKLALAMQTAHEQSIVHRDLKPANIMMTPASEPVIMDFGLARLVDEPEHRSEKQLTKDGALLGTPRYMAPEQVNSELDRIGPATDVYSLGVILFELLTGQTPFTGPLLSVLSQIANSAVPEVSRFKPEVSPQIDLICIRAMAKNPADRFRSMKELCEAVQSVQRSADTVRITPSVSSVTAEFDDESGKVDEPSSEVPPTIRVSAGKTRAEPRSRRRTERTVPEAVTPATRDGQPSAAAKTLRAFGQLLSRVRAGVKYILADETRIAYFMSAVGVSVLLALVLLYLVEQRRRGVVGQTNSEGTGSGEIVTQSSADSAAIVVAEKSFSAEDADKWVSTGSATWSWNGDIMSMGPGTGTVLTETDLADYELHFEFRVGAISSGGDFGVVVNLPSGRTPTDSEIVSGNSGPSVVIEPLGGSSSANPGVGIFIPPAQSQIHQNDWNAVRVIVRNGNVVLYLNDVESGRFEKSASGQGTVTGSASDVKGGRLGFLQRSGLSSEFRAIRVQPISTESELDSGVEVNAAASGQTPDGFTKLFNGKDFDGWVLDPKDTAYWNVGNGMIEATGRDSLVDSWLLTNKEYGDFTLRFQFQMRQYSLANGGFGVRVAATESTPLPIKLLDDNDLSFDSRKQQEKTGAVILKRSNSSIVSIQPRKSAVLRRNGSFQGEWNDVEMTVSGNHFQLKVNGDVIQEGDADTSAGNFGDVSWLKATRGRIGFQIRRSTIRYRNIEIREGGFAADESTIPFESLFNGRDLTGWQARAAANRWTVEGDELVVSGSEGDQAAVTGSWLRTERRFTDFILRMEYRVQPYGRSGVAFRLANNDEAVISHIPLLDEEHFVWASLPSVNRTGSLQSFVRDRAPELKPTSSREWNRLQVELRGDELRVAVNGTTTLVTRLQDHEAEGRRRGAPGEWRTPAPIALQQWTGKVRFRKIEVKDLSPASATTAANGSAPKSSNQTGALIPAQARMFRGRAYAVYTEPLSWQQAKTRCEWLGGKLVSVKSQELNDFLVGLISESTVQSVWVGGSDQDLEGTWRWQDGTAITYTVWRSGHPENVIGAEDYLMLTLANGTRGLRSEWTSQLNVSPQHNAGFICEWPSP
ncbi:MAG: DUF1080 domain-containing protein [Planctomyces sp.]|nr:DUF1080 domain-containing protein [Planctomyces sp.]